MKNRTSSHFFILLLIVVVAAIAHYSIHYGGLIRGYETSSLTAYRNIGLLTLLAVLPIAVKKFLRFDGNWTIYTTAVLLFCGFYALWRSAEDEWNERYYLIAGASAGAALMAEYTSALGVVALVLYGVLSLWWHPLPAAKRNHIPADAIVEVSRLTPSLVT